MLIWTALPARRPRRAARLGVIILVFCKYYRKCYISDLVNKCQDLLQKYSFTDSFFIHKKRSQQTTCLYHKILMIHKNLVVVSCRFSCCRHHSKLAWNKHLAKMLTMRFHLFHKGYCRRTYFEWIDEYISNRKKWTIWMNRWMHK